MVEQLTLNQWVLGSSPRWCTKECLTRKCRAFFYCSISRRHDLVYHWGYSNRAAARKCRKERHSAAFLSPRESPRWCTRKSRNECCGFFAAPFPSGRTHTSRKRSCSSRGDRSLKMLRRSIFLTRPLMVHQEKHGRMYKKLPRFLLYVGLTTF